MSPPAAQTSVLDTALVAKSDSLGSGCFLVQVRPLKCQVPAHRLTHTIFQTDPGRPVHTLIKDDHDAG
ncbi:hypothetical protein SAMN04489712_12627 [Thermomonospora echinospora]|uniref:Uncharacterized protein n=1 Tax=Thermomonospora echinospora TaxID=1992 RepID=A0A1H6E0G5_9ACTN|nr:hypothetical protein SAMN04489712_12627 [Thermomonospora echinospora]